MIKFNNKEIKRDLLEWSKKCLANAFFTPPRISSTEWEMIAESVDAMLQRADMTKEYEASWCVRSCLSPYMTGRQLIEFERKFVNSWRAGVRDRTLPTSLLGLPVLAELAELAELEQIK